MNEEREKEEREMRRTDKEIGESARQRRVREDSEAIELKKALEKDGKKQATQKRESGRACRQH